MQIPVGKEDDDGANNDDANNGDANNGDAKNGDAEANNGDADKNDADTTVEKIKKPAHGPNWLLGRSGISRKRKKEHLNLENAQSTADHTGLKKAIRDELLAEMEEMIEKKVRDKVTKVFCKLGEVDPYFNDIDLEAVLRASDDELDDKEDGNVAAEHGDK